VPTSLTPLPEAHTIALAWAGPGKETHVADRRKSSHAVKSAGKVVQAKVAKSQRRQAVLDATSKVKTSKSVDVSKVLRG
jgi:hypothetical protein